ncbi:DUF1566 domain-containing protein [Thiohalorhabdus sp. Cl-TMA]|uniref:DUF1566 domain-containing protein n=1 Tax=Thiohalorhabdus methylotrophus TaxID=3242694 RepID=A0ABV4TUT4_9GAMM
MAKAGWQRIKNRNGWGLVLVAGAMLHLLSGCSGGGSGGSEDNDPSQTDNGAPTAETASLTTARGLEATVSLTASDPENDTLTYAVSAAPDHGSADIAGDGTLTYTPDAGFLGDDALTYRVTDGNGNEATAEVTVAVPGLNDTGITACGDYAYGNTGNHDNHVDCDDTAEATQTESGTDAEGDPVPAGQDAVYGRDAAERNGTLTKEGGGSAGFDFTKIGSNGNALDANATDWTCVRDNVTGLMWEGKTDDGGLRDKDHTYTWYSPDGDTNGGSAGTQDGGTCAGGIDCDTESYVAEVNNAALCGHSDWRMPTPAELASIVDNSTIGPAVDTGYFPHTAASNYWSASPYAGNSSYAWDVYFFSGLVGNNFKGDANGVRLVRGGQ